MSQTPRLCAKTAIATPTCLPGAGLFYCFFSVIVFNFAVGPRFFFLSRALVFFVVLVNLSAGPFYCCRCPFCLGPFYFSQGPFFLLNVSYAVSADAVEAPRRRRRRRRGRGTGRTATAAAAEEEEVSSCRQPLGKLDVPLGKTGGAPRKTRRAPRNT